MTLLEEFRRESFINEAIERNISKISDGALVSLRHLVSTDQLFHISETQTEASIESVRSHLKTVCDIFGKLIFILKEGRLIQDLTGCGKALRKFPLADITLSPAVSGRRTMYHQEAALREA
jgi:hypothetical protein